MVSYNQLLLEYNIQMSSYVALARRQHCRSNNLMSKHRSAEINLLENKTALADKEYTLE